MMSETARRDAVIEIAKRYDYDSAHCIQVECLAGTLFMELQSLHNLDRDERKLLEFAAILHDIGGFLSHRRHHKHTLQLVMMEPVLELTRSEKLIVANVARYHRKAWPSADHTAYSILTDRERNIVDKLTPLLRLADALDKSHRQRVRELACEIDGDIVTVLATGDDDISTEIVSASARAELFKVIYGLDLKVVDAEHPAGNSE